jgi:hypothetical protein
MVPVFTRDHDLEQLWIRRQTTFPEIYRFRLVSSCKTSSEVVMIRALA